MRSARGTTIFTTAKYGEMTRERCVFHSRPAMMEDARIQCSLRAPFLFLYAFCHSLWLWFAITISRLYLYVRPQSNILALSLCITLFFFLSHFFIVFFFPFLSTLYRDDEIQQQSRDSKERQKDVHTTIMYCRCVCKETNLRAPNHSLCVFVCVYACVCVMRVYTIYR